MLILGRRTFHTHARTRTRTHTHTYVLARSLAQVPLYHFLSVVSIASGAFTLGRTSKKKAAATAAVVGGEAANAAAAAAPHAVEVHYLGPLPVGSSLILFNCVIYGITFRLDKAAVQAAGTQLYYMYITV